MWILSAGSRLTDSHGELGSAASPDIWCNNLYIAHTDSCSWGPPSPLPGLTLITLDMLAHHEQHIVALPAKPHKEVSVLSNGK